jgi:hypothetical protein
MAGGSFLLFKSQTHQARTVVSVILLAGMFGFVKELKADMSTNISIDTHNGSELLGIDNNIYNNTQNIPVKITVDPDWCELDFNNCDILQPGDSCQIGLNCDK